MRALDDDAMFDFDRKQEAELQEPGLAPVARGRIGEYTYTVSDTHRAAGVGHM